MSFHKSNFQPQSEIAGEQLVEILEYFEGGNLRFQVKTKGSLSSWLDINEVKYKHYPNIEQIKDCIQIGNEENEIILELYKSHVTEVQDTFFYEECSWREAAYTIRLKDDTVIEIDVLD